MHQSRKYSFSKVGGSEWNKSEQIMTIERIFSRGGNSGFFDGEAKSGEISFYPLETMKTTFFAKNLIGNVKF